MLPQNSRTRREYLASLAVVGTVSVAGCSTVTSQSFEADPVVLPDDEQESLRLSETARDSRTMTRTGLGDNVDVSVTSHVAVYDRASGLGGE